MQKAYLLTLGSDIKYIGHCKNLKNRINQGYGHIHAKNCFRDGQQTNCRVNALITEIGGDITLWFHIMHGYEFQEIKSIEKKFTY